MIFLHIAFPALLLSASCIGYGMLAMALFRNLLAELPILVRVTTAYFLGQAILVGLFAALGLGGAFVYYSVMGAIIPGAIASIFLLRLYLSNIHELGATTRKSWLRAPRTWRLLSVLAAALYVYGLSTMGRNLEGDASAFYFAAAKLMAHTGRIAMVPAYEYFSWVIMTGEILYASLIVLGSPGTGARFYEWVNFLPLVVAIYSVARQCDLTRRAAFLAAVMTLTSSALVGQWGGGKTDSFAVGPAVIGVWFALASWSVDRRLAYIGISGLFCGVAIAAKISYLIVLPPVAMLLIFWQDVGASIVEFRALAWVKLLQRASRVALVSLPFFAFLAIGLAPFVIKNLILFQAPLGSAMASAGSSWFSGHTIRRLVLTYPIALTYGRYWGQLGTLSPLILAFLPLFFLLPGNQRRWDSPLMATSVSALVSLVIWIILQPSMIMPRYVMATLLLFAIPAAAGAAYVSRGRSVLAAMVVFAAVVTITALPKQVESRSQAFQPARAFEYFRTGLEEPMFAGDPYVATTNAVNRVALPNDRVLLLDYPRVWLRGDLLNSASSTAEVAEATAMLQKQDSSFWNFLQEKNFKFIILNMTKAADMAAVVKLKSVDLEFCEIKTYGGIIAYRIGAGCRACPPGNRTAMRTPFEKTATDGFGFMTKVPELAGIGDTQQLPFLSPVVICEGEARLGPAHASAVDILKLGGGYFSHLEGMLLFSTSDNSDPNNNGRAYTIVRPH